LVQVDQDQSQSVSAVISVPSGKTKGQSISLYPNPTNDVFQIANVEDLELVHIYNITGQLVESRVIEKDSNPFFSLEGQLPGIYQIVLNSGTERQFLSIEKR